MPLAAPPTLRVPCMKPHRTELPSTLLIFTVNFVLLLCLFPRLQRQQQPAGFPISSVVPRDLFAGAVSPAHLPAPRPCMPHCVPY